MGEAVQMVDSARKERVLPMFISVDPARDGVKEVKKYIKGASSIMSFCSIMWWLEIQTDERRLPPENDWVDWRL